VFDKDPVQLARRSPQFDTGNTDAAGNTASDKRYGLAQNTTTTALPGFLGVLARLFELLGLDDLVNRRTEIVKLVVPLQGLTRRHPLVGVLQEDALDQAPSWGVNPLLTAGGALGQLGTLPQAEALAGLIARIGLDMLPRHFVVYVKQRLVLLDALFYIIEVLQFLLAFLSEIQSMASGAGSNKAVRTDELRTRYMTQPAEKRAVVEAVLAEPDVQASFVRAADLSGSDISVSTRNQEFKARVDSRDTALADTIRDPAERRRVAVDEVADSYAAEYPDYQMVQVLAAVQPAEQTLKVVDKLSVARPNGRQKTLADDLAGSGPAVIADRDALPLYAKLRAGLDARKLSDYMSDSVGGADPTLTVRDILSRSPEEAERSLGADGYARFRSAFQADRKAAIDGAEALAKGVPAATADRLEADIGAGTAPDVAIDRLKADTTTGSAARPALDHAATLLRVTGGNAAFLKLVKRTP